jgi:hypothetical protein
LRLSFPRYDFSPLEACIGYVYVHEHVHALRSRDRNRLLSCVSVGKVRLQEEGSTNHPLTNQLRGFLG